MTNLDLTLRESGKESMLSDYSPEPTEWDLRAYDRITCTDLSPSQQRDIAFPHDVYPNQEAVLAVHWHPEFVPIGLILERLQRLFPKADEKLIIPTQHNMVLSVDRYAGVEVDCFSRGFNRKVQLLLHLEKDRASKAHALQAMIDQTFAYRSTQLHEYLEAVIDPALETNQREAMINTGADATLTAFVRAHGARLLAMLRQKQEGTPLIMIRNKLVESYFNELRELHDDQLVERSLVFLRQVKKKVKADFSNQHFFETSEMIEEARAAGACIVIPHPEQFWPILLADYDVDGYEVWNPQSRQYTEFLIENAQRSNHSRGRSQRPLLIFMGDDTHLSEKTMAPCLQNQDRAAREVGLQPAWHDAAVKNILNRLGFTRAGIIREYRARIEAGGHI